MSNIMDIIATETHGKSYRTFKYSFEGNDILTFNYDDTCFDVCARMGKSEFVSMESLFKICSILNCIIGDIVDFFPESEELNK